VSAGAARRPNRDPLAEQLFQDLEGKGWRITWDDAGKHFRVACPHDGKFVYEWPMALEPGWRRADHFKRLNDGHKDKKECLA
jgi:hypothetical protein